MKSKIKDKNGEHPFGDVGQLILLVMFFMIWVGDSFFLRTSTFLGDHIPFYIRLVLFGAMFGTAIYLFNSVHFIAVSSERPLTVVSTGIFRYVRHPLYLASMLGYIGLIVLTASLLSLALLMVIFVFYNYIASYEEKLLEERFGELYKDYKKRTGKWMPKIIKGRYLAATKKDDS